MGIHGSHTPPLDPRDHGSGAQVGAGYGIRHEDPVALRQFFAHRDRAQAGPLGDDVGVHARRRDRHDLSLPRRQLAQALHRCWGAPPLDRRLDHRQPGGRRLEHLHQVLAVEIRTLLDVRPAHIHPAVRTMEVPRIVLAKDDNPDVVMALPQRAAEFDAIQGIRPQGPVQQRHVERLLDPQGLGRAAHRRHDLDSRQPLQQGRHHRPQHGIVLHVKKTRIPRHATIVSPFARTLTRGVHVYPRAGTRVEQ